MSFLELLFGSHMLEFCLFSMLFLRCRGKSGNTRESTASIFLWHYRGGSHQETLFGNGAVEVISSVSTSLSPFYIIRHVYQ